MRKIPLPGTAVDQLDTPVLVIDLDALEKNINVIATHYSDTKIKLRPHVKNHKSPQIAWMQVNAGGTVGGVCAAKVSEAEVFVEAGFPNVLIANQIVSAPKIQRLMSLAKRANLMVVVDDLEQVKLLSESALKTNSTLGVLIEVNTMMRRGGIRSVEQGVSLAREIVAAPGLVFKGVQSHQVPETDAPNTAERFDQGQKFIGMVLDVKSAIEEVGITVEIVSTGESWSYDIAASMPGVTEIEGGTYIVMEVPYSYMSEFTLAAKVIGTIVSKPSENTAIGDISIEAIGSPNGPPTVEAQEDVVVESMSLEHTVLKSTKSMPLDVGDRYTLLTHQQDITMNRWDQYVGIRNGVVEAVFDVTARGCSN